MLLKIEIIIEVMISCVLHIYFVGIFNKKKRKKQNKKISLLFLIFGFNFIKIELFLVIVFWFYLPGERGGIQRF